MKKIISIDGNIGSGKSTLIKKLQEKTNLVVITEPVDSWMKMYDENGKNLLELFYENQEKYAFLFQLTAYITRLQTWRDANQDNIIISERSIWTDFHVFAKMLYDDKKITQLEYNIYLLWIQGFQQEFKLEKIIYINTTPEKCYERIHKRNRDGEVIPLDYLKKCHDYHVSYLSDRNYLLIDGNEEFETNDELLDKMIEKILNFI